MLPYKRFEAAEVTEASGSQYGSHGSQVLAGGAATAVTTASVASQLPSDLDLGMVLAVNRALTNGLTQTQIIEDILKFKGRKFEEGKRLFETIKAIIEEHS